MLSILARCAAQKSALVIRDPGSGAAKTGIGGGAAATGRGEASANPRACRARIARQSAAVVADSAGSFQSWWRRTR